VANTFRSVRFQISQASMVPAISLPAAKASRATAEFRASHDSLLAENKDRV